MPINFKAMLAAEQAQTGPHFPGFVRLANGRNEFRIFKKPFAFGVHWLSANEGKQLRVLCEPGSCEVCGNEALSFRERTPQKRYSMWVTVSQGLTLKVWEMGAGLFRDVSKIVCENPKTEDYDIEVWREGEGIDTRYRVLKMPEFKYKPETYKEIDDKISMYNMKGLVGDKALKAEMILAFGEEQRILDKAW